ncbi:MAG TPA: urease accessory protein UreF [Hyphomicrobiaceae bacterium]|nr:urease accessory protein UreF [Hyphomicrobiaceae bacterium]
MNDAVPRALEVAPVGETPPSAADPSALLLIWLSPSFPVGAFAYSHGLEQAVERRWVKDRESLTAWLSDIAAHGSLPNDLILLAESWRTAGKPDLDRLRELAGLSAALQPSAERYLEATQQGRSFLATVNAAWPCDIVSSLHARLADAPLGYPVAVGVAASGHSIPLVDTLTGYALAFIGNLVSAAIRLGVVGQTDGQRVIAELRPTLVGAASRAVSSSLDDLGSAAFLSDIASLAHETQYSRLFRS